MEIMHFLVMTEVAHLFPGMTANVGSAYNVCREIPFNVCLVTCTHLGYNTHLSHGCAHHCPHGCTWLCNVQAEWWPGTIPVTCALLDHGSEMDWALCWIKAEHPGVTAAVRAVMGLYWMFWAVWGFGCDLMHTKAKAVFCCWLWWVCL